MVQFRLDIHRCSLLGDSALLIILPLYLVIRHLCIPSWPLSQREREKAIPEQSAPSLRRWPGSYVHHLSSHPFSLNLVMWQYPLHRALGNVPICTGAVIKGVKDGRDTERLSVQFSSVAQSCPTLCHPMNRSTPGLPVHHQLPEFTQTHAHWVSDAIQPSHPLSSPPPPALNLSQQQWLQWVSSSHQVAKVLEFQHQSFQWTPRTDLL